MVDSTAPPASIAGPPESPWRTSPPMLVIVRSTGPFPYASSVKTEAVSPIRPGFESSGPFAA